MDSHCILVEAFVEKKTEVIQRNLSSPASSMRRAILYGRCYRSSPPETLVGPKGLTVRFAKMDFRPGGIFTMYAIPGRPDSGGRFALRRIFHRSESNS